MESRLNTAAASWPGAKLLLGIDTCGPAGTVALGRIAGGAETPASAGRVVELLGQIELEGRSYSARLVAAVGELLKRAGAAGKDIDAIVAVNGPGSFTGVRVGLSAVKGLAEPWGTPVAAISRLRVLAHCSGAEASALDARRGEVFLRLSGGAAPSPGLVRDRARPEAGGWAQGRGAGLDRGGLPLALEFVAGAAELETILPVPSSMAVCDEGSAALLASAWPESQLIRVSAPAAADALSAAVDLGLAGLLVDAALLDGNYLRRPAVEIAGEAAGARSR